MDTIMTDLLERKATKPMTDTSSKRRLLDDAMSNNGQHKQPDMVTYYRNSASMNCDLPYSALTS